MALFIKAHLNRINLKDRAISSMLRMKQSIKEHGMIINLMDLEYNHIKMEASMKDNSSKERNRDMERSLGPMEKSILENSRKDLWMDLEN
jgi:hypothetical protein